MLAGVLAITVVGFSAFDVVAMYELRQYLLQRTDTLLQQVLTITAPRLDALLRREQNGRPPRIRR